MHQIAVKKEEVNNNDEIYTSVLLNRLGKINDITIISALSTVGMPIVRDNLMVYDK